MSEDNSKDVEEKVEEPKATAENTAVETKEDEVAEAATSSEKAPEKKEETAADLLGANIEQVKVRKAKGSKTNLYSQKHSLNQLPNLAQTQLQMF